MGRRTTKDVRKKLETIGVYIPKGMNMFHVKGDTYHLIGFAPDEWTQATIAAIRRNGYFVNRLQPDSGQVFIMIINLYGTEWQDGLIPENLAGLPLREPDDKQLPLL